MKKLSFSMLALAGLLFVGCAENDAIVEGGGQQEEIPAEGYVSLAINLPTSSSSTRAGTENDQFNDGLEKEYNVKDCALLFFKVTEDGSANDAVLFSAQGVPPQTPIKDIDNDNITSTYRVVASISGDDVEGNDVYVLAALNYQSVIKISGGNAYIGTVSDANKISTLSDLHKTTNVDLIENVKYATQGTGYFFMTNALLSETKGGDNDPTGAEIVQLAKIDKSKIFNTKENAEKYPAGEVLVERAVAKATLHLGSNVQVGTTKIGDGANSATITAIEWTLDNLEPNTYIARYPGTAEQQVYIGYRSAAELRYPYRFVSHTSTKDATSLGTATDYYRTYWCIDPQYDEEDATLDGYANNKIVDSQGFHEMGIDKPLYCYENTFDVARQMYKNTTRAIIKVKLGDGSKFYTFDEDQLYYTEDAVKQNVVAYALDNALVQNTIQDYYIGTGTYSYADLKNYVEVILTAPNDEKSCDVSSLTLVDSYNGADSPFKNTELFKEGVKGAVQTVLNNIISAINQTHSIYEYSEGVMYYEARFLHFGDDLTPWNKTEYGTGTAPAAGGINKAYPGIGGTADEVKQAEKNYLGRYGMVRNNWYDVTIEEFKKFGSPIDPTGSVSGDDTPDDNLNEFISVKIHVLAWAKRLQNWKF